MILRDDIKTRTLSIVILNINKASLCSFAYPKTNSSLVLCSWITNLYFLIIKVPSFLTFTWLIYAYRFNLQVIPFFVSIMRNCQFNHCLLHWNLAFVTWIKSYLKILKNYLVTVFLVTSLLLFFHFFFFFQIRTRIISCSDDCSLCQNSQGPNSLLGIQHKILLL